MIFGRRKVRKLRDVDRSYRREQHLLDDYEAAEAIGRVRFTHPDDSPAIYYYRLILVHGEKEFANLIFNKEKEADDALEKLAARCPDMAVGYVPPPGGRKPSFK